MGGKGGADGAVRAVHYVNQFFGGIGGEAQAGVVLGGMGSFAGALAGGLIVGVGESVGAMFIPGSMKQIVTFTLFVLILLFRPRGLFGGRAT